MVKRVHKEYSRIDSVRLVGHADPLGSADANQRISLARAEAVRDYLKNSDLIQATIQAEGRGDKEPLVKQCGKAITDASVQCNKPNRRVQIEVMGVKR
jgi:OOP family OmpA-OmpF porin